MNHDEGLSWSLGFHQILRCAFKSLAKWVDKALISSAKLHLSIQIKQPNCRYVVTAGSSFGLYTLDVWLFSLELLPIAC